jgi:hypothetical protein
VNKEIHIVLPGYCQYCHQTVSWGHLLPLLMIWGILKEQDISVANTFKEE